MLYFSKENEKKLLAYVPAFERYFCLFKRLRLYDPLNDISVIMLGCMNM